MRCVNGTVCAVAGLALWSALAATVFAQTPPAEWNQLPLAGFLDQLAQAKLSDKTNGEAASAWLAANDVNTVSDPKLLERIHRLLDLADDRADKFTVCWTGFVKAPYDGDYIFSICPINPNCYILPYRNNQRMSVSVAGQQIINATDKNWASESQAVSLKAGVNTPLRVEFSYARRYKEFFSNDTKTPVICWQVPAIARLSWQGPGITKQLVPAGAFVAPDGATAGLSAEYRLMARDAEQPFKTATVTEPKIDRVWAMYAPVMAGYSAPKARVAARVAALATAADYLTQLESNPGTPHFLLESTDAAESLLSLLSAEQRAAIAEELIARPTLLSSASRATILFSWYHGCRIASPDTALRLVAAWARLHPESDTEFRLNMYRRDCADFADLGFAIAWEYPPHWDLFERNYLALADGGCCVPVANALSVAYAMHGRILEWIEKLDTRLKDAALVGDRRAGWLFARAWAEEVRYSGKGQYRPTHHFLAGRHWLEEVCLTAQSEPVRLQAYKEIAVRQAGYERIAAARATLDQAAQRCSLPESATKIALYRQQLNDVEQRFAKKHKELEEAGRKAYWDEIRRRYNKAVDAEDHATISRYQQMMDNAGEKP